MPKRALIDKRPWLLASLVMGVGYYFVRDSQMPGLYQMVWKAFPVGLLALWAMQRHRGQDAAMIAGVMALGALGDVAIELDQGAGAFAFLLGHLLAVTLYLRHRRVRPSFSQKALALALLVFVPVMGWFLPADRGAAQLAALYALSLGAMAAAAWTSRFNRYRVGMGALLFVVSDLLIFAGIGRTEQAAPWPGLIWPLYYFGQFLICTGVIDGLRSRMDAT